MNRFAHPERLPRFLLLSLTVHLLLLAGFGAGTIEVTRRFLGQPILQVQMQGASHALPSFQAPRASVIAEVSNVEPADHRSPLNALPRNDDLDTTGEPVTEHQGYDELEVEIAAEATIRNQLLGELRTSLSRYLVYPPLARSRGWEGTVLLGLSVESDGRLDKIHVARSSGYTVLDDSAVNSLKRLGNLIEARVWLEGHGMDIQLPVIYKLIEN